MNRRRGITLTEVLVAIFVTGLGLMALMTLFPLGALNMAQAIKDDRAAHCAANASAYLRTWWRTQLQNGTADTFGPNYPVYVDPIGVSTVGANPVGGAIPRVGAPWATNAADIYRQFSLLDDIVFGANGLAYEPTGALQRQGTYSWAYMVRRLNNDPRVLEYEIVVYSGRGLNLSSSLGLSGESAYTVAATAVGGNTLSIAGQPKVHKGGWILDGTNGYFYRVRSVTSSGGGEFIVVETPFRASFTTAIVMENVAEVFERSTLE